MTKTANKTKKKSKRTTDTSRKIARLTAERDEARKMYCRAMAENGQESEEREIAEDLDWDCWKEDGK